jgi:hypothetical protein
MEWLCWFLGGSAIAVVLGHFGWVLVARIFGYQVKTTRAGKAAGTLCPRCRSAALSPQGMCMLCGYSNRAPALPTVDSTDLGRTANYLTRFLNEGLIDADTHAKVQAAVRAEQKRSAMQGLMRGAPQAQNPHLPPPLPPMPVLPANEGPGGPPQFDDRGWPLDAQGVPEESRPLPPMSPAPGVEPLSSAPADSGIATPELTPPPPIPLPPPRRIPPPPKPRRPLSQVFAAFMEENNIRWGELVGGLLIVGCSVALVISFWGQIQALPWLQFSVFTAVTAGLFGLGLYTEHRWKLPTTSRGILLIATLLVPLNFLAFAAFSKGAAPSAISLGAELVAFALFGWLVWQAGKVIAPLWPQLLTTGVCGLSSSLLALRYAGGISHPSWSHLYGFALLPLACYGAVSAGMLRRARRWATIDAQGANAVLLLLGVLSFGTALALGLLVSLPLDRTAALRQLSPLVSLAGIPALTGGLLLWRRVTDAALAKHRTAGTAVAVIGAGILLAGIALAWPNPASMLPVAACDFVVLTVLALLYDVPAAHFLALPCFLLAWLLGFHLLRGNIAWANGDSRQALEALLKPIGGTALVPLVLLLAGAREWLVRRSKAAHARAYGIVALLVATLSLAMVTWGGFAQVGDPLGATWGYLVYSALAFAWAWRSGRIDAACAGWALLLAGVVQGFVAHRLTQNPWSAGLLVGAALATIADACAGRLGGKGIRLVRQTSRWVEMMAVGAAVAVALSDYSASNAGRTAGIVFIAAAIVFAVALIERAPVIFLAANTLLSGGSVLAVTAWLGPQSIVCMVHIFTLSLSACGLAWLAARTIAARGHDRGRIPRPLKIQVAIALGLGTLLVFASGFLLVAWPSMAASAIREAGQGWGWPMLVVAMAAAVWLETAQRGKPALRLLGLCGLALATMLGLSVVSSSSQGWMGFHTLLASTAFVAWVMLGIGWLLVREARADAPFAFWQPATTGPDTSNAEPSSAPAEAGVAPPRPIAPPEGGAPVLTYQRPSARATPAITPGVENIRIEAVRWAFGIGMLVAALGIRALAGDPDAPWWSMGAALSTALLATTIACWGPRPAFLYASGLLLNLAAGMWFAYRGTFLSGAGWVNFLCVQAIAAALPGVAWLVLHLQIFRRSQALRGPNRIPYHHVAAIGAAIVCAAIATLLLVSQILGGDAAPDPLALALAMLCTTGLLAASLLDRSARHPLPGLYLMGLSAIGAGVALSARGNWVIWRTGIALGIYTLAVALLWKERGRLRGIFRPRETPAEGVLERSALWLVPANIYFGMTVVGIAFWADFTISPAWSRMLTAVAALLQAPMLALLAERDRRSDLRSLALLVLAVAMIACGWSWLDPRSFPPDELLDRVIVVFTVFITVAAFYSLALPRIFGPTALWTEAGRRIAAPLGVAAAMALAGILLLEAFGRAMAAGFSVGTPEVLIVLAALLTGCAGALVAALRRGETSGLSDRVRVRCVYAAEAMLALAFVHLRLTEPQLFGGVFQQYWPLIIMAVAFAGVGAGELLARQKHFILSEPLTRTGIFLPLLPVIGFWLPGPRVNVSLTGLLLTVCVFYAMLAALRKSFAFGLIAAMAANGALWSVLSGISGWGIAQHPQVWFIPAALSVLAAAQLNRSRLTPDTLRTIRYGCLLVVYVSSTADVFLNGVAVAPWLPLVLAGLSVAGVLVGVMFRVRPFLFLGTAFLALSVVTMIYYASSQLQWTWIWYVAGILLGSAIIVLFALFEKKRTEMLALVEGLKQWQ